MSVAETDYLEKLSTGLRGKLLEFISKSDQIIGDGDFDRFREWKDCELMALALRSAFILGFEENRLEELFRNKFGIGGVTESLLGEWLAAVMRLDIERRILVAAGGRN
jgi:hypothetical protein